MVEQSDLKPRAFVANVLGAAGVLTVASRPGAVFAQTDPTVCANPKPFKPGMDTRPITERRTVVQLASDAAWKKKLEAGYAAMRNFASNDPRSLTQQGNMHNLMCHGGTKEVHGSDRFLAWHRCFVYFQERIVASNVGYSGSGAPTPKAPDPTFRLAIWNWEGAAAPVFPASFATGALNDPNRANDPSTFYANEGNIVPALDVQATDPFTFYGYPVGGQGASPVLENGPHGRIHVSTGKQSGAYHDMGNLSTAALDPVFCAHHGNIDRVWAWWQQLRGNVTPNSVNPATGTPYDPAWIKNVWVFTDWDGTCYSITPADIIDYRTNLRYSYPAPPTTRKVKSLSLQLSASGLKGAAAPQAQSASLILNGLDIPAPGTGQFSLVAKSGGVSRIVGRFALFGMPMTAPTRANVLAEVTQAGVAAIRAGEALSVAPARTSVAAPNLLGAAQGVPLRVRSAKLVIAQ